MTTAVLLLSACGTVQIADFTACSLIPGNQGAVCDNFLESDPTTYDETGWEDLEASWNAQGDSVECTSSTSLANFKKELEKLCSVAKCSYSQKQSIKSFFLRKEKSRKLVLSIGKKD